MGYNFWYVIVTETKNEEKLMNYINENGKFSNDGRYYSGKFSIDEEIKYYLRAYNSDEEIVKILEVGYAEIGVIYFDKWRISNIKDKVAFSFMAATRGMSHLFDKSSSVYRWFIDLSKYSNSLGTVLEKEHFGYHILYYKEKEISIDVKFDDALQNQEDLKQFYSIETDFRELSKIFWSGKSDKDI